jgi:hypothetical protein
MYGLADFYFSLHSKKFMQKYVVQWQDQGLWWLGASGTYPNLVAPSSNLTSKMPSRGTHGLPGRSYAASAPLRFRHDQGVLRWLLLP